MTDKTKTAIQVSIVVAAFIAAACADLGPSAPRVCGDISECLSTGTWTTDVHSLSKGQLIQGSGAGGVITFNKNMTGTTTEAFLQGYANGTYYSAFTYAVDVSKFTLTISFDIPPTNPTQLETFTITSAYENEIRMERPMIGGTMICILTK